MAKLETPRCPKCGDFARGTLEWIPGTARITLEPDGTFDYDERGTDLVWDGSMNEVRLAKVLALKPGYASALEYDPGPDPVTALRLVCPDGHEWVSRQLD